MRPGKLAPREPPLVTEYNRPLCKVPSYGKLGVDERADCLVHRRPDALMHFS